MGYRIRGSRLPLALMILPWIAGCESSAENGAASAGEHAHVGAFTDVEGSGGVPLYHNLGEHHLQISTADSRAQQFFDQGLRLSFGFNHAEAIRSFEAATRFDPQCAMCYWGIAYAHGPNINAPMDEAAGREAFAAIQQARSLAGNVTDAERALIDATAVRYADPPPAERAALDSAYARALGDAHRAHPEHLEIATLYAEALMNLRPWDYWQADGSPHPGTETIVSTLERVIARNPNHPGACHFYIHAVEANEPEKAVACADRLAALMPGAGHMVHMPAHIYIRVGRWNDAIESNEHAVHADESYISDQRPTGLYPLAYYPHNYHFLSFAAMMVGRSAQAIEAARGTVENVNVDVAREVLELQGLVPYLHLAYVTFGRWDDILADPIPSADLPLSHGLAQYARGVAFAATARADEAGQALAALESVRASLDAEPAATVLGIASHALQGEIAHRGGNHEGAITHFRAAMELEDALPYMEPPFWYYPIRHSLGAVLLDAGRPAEAERLYREDLVRFPENGWSLLGLANSLEAQGKEAESSEVRARFTRVWTHADVTPQASRF